MQMTCCPRVYGDGDGDNTQLREVRVTLNTLSIITRTAPRPAHHTLQTD